ncbi:phosphoenolpyruvate--protein phosphotransferase [Microbacterium sp. NPDC058342]|uniref:phosphoenolpyruvate--protein phosphotransferase n=1 Tax=Microbacterium sp. NPDC058342 TaxID=3346454 RepID=UPI0036661C68
MIGIVAVSHSARLGEAALELALQMVRGDRVAIRVAAGAGQDAAGTPILGTDAVAVAAAVDELAVECEGVLVLMDLGSAVLSAELALELRASDVPVRLAAAPFVEGMLAAAVSAAAGATLETVADEASRALDPKHQQLGDAPAETPAPDGRSARAVPEVSQVVRVRNPQGIHARPAALIAESSAGAEVRLRRLPDGPDAPASSLSRLLALGAGQGDRLELTGWGPAAPAALDRLIALFEDGFGEGTEGASAPDAASPGVGASGDAHMPAPAAGTVLHGRGVSAGTAAAVVVRPVAGVPEPEPGALLDDRERDRQAEAIGSAADAVAERFRVRAAAGSGEAREILDAARLIAADPEIIADAAAAVRATGCTAARAVWEAMAQSERSLLALGGRAAERAIDVRDVRDRIIAELLGLEMPGVPERDEPFVLVADDLAPADTAALEGGRCVALVTERGGPTSHTAIISRALGLPAVVGVAAAGRIPPGTMVLVDGDLGTVEVEPSASRIAAATEPTEAVVFDGAGRLADGTAVPLLANVGGAADARAAAGAHAEGVGLFRTEFGFLGRTDPPGEAEQVQAYRGVLSPFAGRRIVVRTLDAGSDKPLPFIRSGDEENPALGVRGIRTSRADPTLLEGQLRALVAAAAAESAVVEVMAPMVSTVDEASAFAARARAAGADRVGVMIETPAAALMADELFQIVDFVSIGTNDLTQYTLAADRLLGELGDLSDPWQPSVLRLIAHVGDSGRRAGRAVGVCGEAAGDAALAPVLVGLGATSLSMSSRSLGRVAQSLRRVGADDCRRAAEAARNAATADEARALAGAVLRRAD